MAKSAQRALARLPKSIQARIVERIDAVENEPRPPTATNVVGAPNTYRIRVGDYRIVYEIQDAVLIVLVIRVGHRREVYRDR
ncbi:MAG: type II toxin-antitoxin system RelE/ParE family toxin [Candidatus Hydrogenedentes bacterium]|nr:type II toxin-antitoxin system RelE/ParE family toxin [Candidatus Hydrogenedentota bacterium]